LRLANGMSAWRCLLEPDLNFVAIRIGDVSAGEAGCELATTEQAPPGEFDLGDRTVDVVGVHESKTPQSGRTCRTWMVCILDRRLAVA